MTGEGVLPTPPPRPAWLRRARPLLLLLAVSLLVAAVVRQGSDVLDRVDELSPGPVAASGLLVLLALFAAMLSWRAVLSGLGSELPVGAAARVYFLSQLGKYVPGSVWALVAQVELARDLGVPRKRSAAAAALAIVTGALTGVVVAGVAAALVVDVPVVRAGGLLAALLAVAVVLEARLLGRVLDRLLRLARRGPLEAPASRETLIRSSAWVTVMWLLLGGHLAILAADLDGDGGATLLLRSTGVYAAAWVAGFAVLFLPAGAGVRELVISYGLSPVLPIGAATLLALCSRLLMTLGDGVVAAAAVVAERRRGTRPAAVEERDEQAP